MSEPSGIDSEKNVQEETSLAFQALSTAEKRSQTARHMVRADVGERGLNVIEEIAGGLDRRSILFAPQAAWDERTVELKGPVACRQLAKALLEGFRRVFPARTVRSFLELPPSPARFVRIRHDNQPLLVAPREGAERVASAWRLPGDERSGCLAVVLSEIQGWSLRDESRRTRESGEGFLLVQLGDGYIGNVAAGACEFSSPEEWLEFWERRRSPEREERLVRESKRWLGAPYLWGGSSRKEGLDCSAFVQLVMARSERLAAPRDAAQQARQGVPAGLLRDRSDLFPGDLLFFVSERGRIYHVGMSLGGSDFIHAAGGQGVVEASLDPKSPAWAEKHAPDFAFARRYWL